MTGRLFARRLDFSLGQLGRVRLFAIYAGHQGPRMGEHKFRIGQSVAYRSRGADAPQGVYVIVALLPQREDGEFEYRIKHSHEDHQRSAKESELRPQRVPKL